MALKRALERIALPLARAAHRLVQTRTWTFFGYAHVEDYARERLGRSGRFVRDLAALARATERLPALDLALTGDDGGRPLGRVATLAVARVATVESVAAWIARARTRTVRELKDEVRRARAAGSTWPAEDGAEEVVDDDARSEDASADLAERSLVTLPAPSAVRAAFDETVQLHSAIVGHQTGVSSFVEDLVADALSGPHPPDVDCRRLARGAATARLEAALAESTRRWCELRGQPRAVDLAVVRVLDRLTDLAARGCAGGPAELDAQLRELIKLENDIERRLGSLLAEMGSEGGWSSLGFAGVGHYAEERLGLGRSTAEERVRLRRALADLPLLRRAYELDEVGAAAALVVVRTVGPGPVDAEVESAWVRRAADATVKRLRDEGRAIGLLRLAEPSPRRRGPLDDGQWYNSLRQAPGELRDRVRELLSRAATSPEPDGFLRLRLPGALARDFLAAVEAARQRVADDAKHGPGGEASAGESPALAAARTFSATGRPVPAWVGLATLLEEFADTWDDSRSVPRRVQNRVYVRDGWRCTAPGCTSRRGLEDHHVKYRSRGGDPRAASNRTTACAFHHRLGEHGELATCRGRAPLGLLWGLGRSDLRSWYRNELRL